MIKRIVSILVILLTTTVIKAGIGEWRIYPSYHNATKCCIVDDKIYVLASGALFSYNKSDNEVYTYDKINSLSDIEITNIEYCKDIEALVVLYSNANIDILYNDGEVYNISDFKNKTLPRKKINNIEIYNSTAYISTEFGVVVLDLEKLEFSNTYNTELDTYCTFPFKNHLYTGTANGVFRCDTTKNFLDRNNWEYVHEYPTHSFCELNGELFCTIKHLGLYTLNSDTKRLKLIIKKEGDGYYSLSNVGGEIIAQSTDKFAIIRNVNDYKVIQYDKKCEYIAKDNDSFWLCKGYGGIVECKIDNNVIEEISVAVKPNSPIRNYCEFMKFTTDNKLLVTGGNINYFDKNFYDGTVMEFNTNSGNWTNLPEDIIKETTGLKYVNICSIDEDPTEEGHYFVSSFGYGIYEFRNGEFIKHYNHKNSILESVVTTEDAMSRYIRIPMVKFDSYGNLWCVNTGVTDIVKILKKDGTWITLNYKEIEKLPTMVELLVDSRNWLWMTSLQAEPGIFCAKTNNTLYDTSDDMTKIWLHKFTNQDGTSYDIYQVYALREDMNGHMWVGTNTGLFVIDNPESFFNNGILRQIKVSRNDGTGLADYLLNGVYIKAIEIDGANRKWIGTNDNGIYLISADGQETIHHFTTENSPLPSNTIESIAINSSGEVFIGTSKGIASYRSDATTAEPELDSNNIHAFPNPVRADYNGNISITGLTIDCNVKIVDSAGYLIDEGTSNGGIYNWNGRNIKGEKVASGVYYVLVYDEYGNESGSTKILITR